MSGGARAWPLAWGLGGVSHTGPISVFIPAGLSFTSTTWQRTTSSALRPSPRSLPWGCGGCCGGDRVPWPLRVLGEAELGSHTDGSHCSLQPEEKQKATQQFNKLQAAMKVMGISGDEQKAFWLILGAIYHLGAAGATKGNGAAQGWEALTSRGSGLMAAWGPGVIASTLAPCKRPPWCGQALGGVFAAMSAEGQ